MLDFIICQNCEAMPDSSFTVTTFAKIVRQCPTDPSQSQHVCKAHTGGKGKANTPNQRMYTDHHVHIYRCCTQDGSSPLRLHFGEVGLQFLPLPQALATVFREVKVGDIGLPRLQQAPDAPAEVRDRHITQRSLP